MSNDNDDSNLNDPVLFHSDAIVYVGLEKLSEILKTLKKKTVKEEIDE
jgi:hypothetical protein